jgi:hypothetical protein
MHLIDRCCIYYGRYHILCDHDLTLEIDISYSWSCTLKFVERLRVNNKSVKLLYSCPLNKLKFKRLFFRMSFSNRSFESLEEREVLSLNLFELGYLSSLGVLPLLRQKN